MISTQTRRFEIGEKKYQFDSQAFKVYIKKYSECNGFRHTKAFEKIAERVNVTPEAVKQWYYGNNGPSEIGMVYGIAETLDGLDYMKLLKTVNEVQHMETLSVMQIESFKRIYDAIIDYLEDFYTTDGFTGSLWYFYVKRGSKDPEQDIYEYAEKKIEAVLKVIKKEYFYLRNTTAYEEISEYADNDLYDIFNGKLSYAYRFEAIVDGNPTTEDDYMKALNKLNDIIEKYIP